MKKHYNYFLIFISLLFLAAFSSCQYENPYVTPIPVNKTVSFSTDIQPIFNSVGCVSCHKAGAESPDLTTGNAYQDIMSMNLVDTVNPESSLIYWEPNPDNTAAHTWKKYTATQAELVLKWIQQGAKDN
jgi:hypothetical protein